MTPQDKSIMDLKIDFEIGSYVIVWNKFRNLKMYFKNLET
jgi:hypothetical protein